MAAERRKGAITGFNAHTDCFQLTARSGKALESTPDVLFDSFSESREDSSHGAAKLLPSEESKDGLFHLLSEAALALNGQGERCS